MKKAFLYSIFVAALAVVSCQKEGLDPLTGVFPEATVSNLTTLVSTDAVKTETTREFSFQFTGENGSTLETVLVLARANYALKAGSYVPGTTNGSFLAARTKVNGQPVTDQSGVIVVRNTEGSSTYTFECALFDQSGHAYRSFWKGEIVYTPDPEPVNLTTLYYAQANTNNTVSIKVGTPGLELDMVGIPSGSGNLFTADLYSPDGYLHEGTYTVGTAEATGEGQFTPGYAYDLTEYGMGVAHWGTCWWVNGEATDLNSGTITVAKKGAKWVITWGEEATYPNWAVFEGEIEALTPAGGGEYDGVSLTQNFGIIDYSMYGMKMVGIELGTSGIVATAGGWGNTYTGNGNYLKLEIYSEDGKIAPGTYKACTTGGEIGPGEFGIGYDGMYGASGTTWYTLVNDEATYKYITDGTVTVEVDGDDYKITLESSVVNARYGFGEGGGGSDAPEYTITETLGGAVDSNFATVEGVTTHSLALTKVGETEPSAWFDLVLTEGVTDLSGEYVSTEYAHEDHTCGNGYDLSAYGWGVGGCRYMKDGALVLVEVGAKVTVTAVSEGVWKFSGEGFEFVGAMAE